MPMYRDNNNETSQTNPIPWTARVVFVAIALLLGLLNDVLKGWGLPAGMAGVAIIVPTLKYQKYWHAQWFRLTIIVLSLTQIPLVILVRPLMERLRFGFNLLFVSMDAIAVIIAVNLIRPKESGGSPTPSP